MGAVMDQPLSLAEAGQLLSRHGFTLDRSRGHRVYRHPDHPDLLISLNNGIDRSGARDVRRAIAVVEARQQGKAPVVPRRASHKMLPFDGEEEFFHAAERRQQEARLARGGAKETVYAASAPHPPAPVPVPPPALAPAAAPSPSPAPVEVPVPVIPTALAEAVTRPSTEEYILALDASQREALVEIQQILTRRAQAATLGLGVVEISAERVLQLAVTRGLVALAAEVRA